MRGGRKEIDMQQWIILCFRYCLGLCCFTIFNLDKRNIKKGNVRFSIGQFRCMHMESANNYKQLDSKANFVFIIFKINWNITTIKHENLTELIAFQKEICLKYN